MDELKFLSATTGDEMPPAIGRYEIIYPIAAGGMASVYVARLAGMAGFERLFAIKVIHAHLAREQSFIEMFLDEARLAARIHHPNVGEIFEVGEDGGRFYMVGELVLGQDLKSLIARSRSTGRSLSHFLIADMVADVSAGLDEAHNLRDENGEPMNLVHRDISTRNILVSYKGHVKLIDFGVAFARGRLSHTRDGTAKGKIGYMPPEQLKGEAVDRRTDIFAMGVVLYTLIAGEHPFPYDNEGQQVAKILAGEFRLLQEHDPSVDEALERIVLRAMADSPEDRYGTARELEEALRGYSRSRGGGATALSSLMSSMFEGEIVAHDDRIRMHRELANAAIPVMAVPPAEGRVTVVQKRRRRTSSDRNTSIVREVMARAMRDKRTIRLMTVGVLILSVAVVLLLFLRVHPANERPTPETSPLAPAEERKKAPAPSEPGVGDRDVATRPASPADVVVIDFEGIEAGGRLTCDGEPATSPLALPRSDKPVRVRVTAPGFKGVEKTVVPSRDQTIRFEMKRIPQKPAKTADDRRGQGRKRKPAPRRKETTSSKGALDGWEANPF